jgi:TRAP transporter TAXI family solute receptor
MGSVVKRMVNKKLAVLTVVLSFVLLLAACGGKTFAPAAGEGKEQAQASNSAGISGNQTNTVGSLKLTMAGGSAGGFWSMLGEGVGNVLRQAIPNTQFSYETGNGVKNILSVNAGKLQLGIAFNFEVKTALNGEEPFKEKVPQVMALVTLYNNSPHQMAITKDFADKYGIKSLDDIVRKKPPFRVAVNQRGNLLEKVNRIIFESYGITYDDIKKWGGDVYYEPYKSGADMMKDNKNDFIGASVFAPDGVFLELATNKPIQFISINEKAQKQLQEKLNMMPSVMKVGTYKFQTEDVATASAGAMIVVDPKMSNEEAYAITKALIENLDKIKAIHKNLQDLTPKIMTNVFPAKLHPGAEQYFREMGYLK